MDSIGDVLQAYVSVREFLEFSNFLTYPRYNSIHSESYFAIILFFYVQCGGIFCRLLSRMPFIKITKKYAIIIYHGFMNHLFGSLCKAILLYVEV